MHSKLAKFLEANGHKEQAFLVTKDNDHKFDLAIHLSKIAEAFEIAQIQDSAEKKRKVGDLALLVGNFSLAEQCFLASNDFNSLLMFYSSCGNREGLENLAEMAFEKGKFNIAFQCYFMTSEASKCYDVLMKSGKVSECVYFARAYIPSKLP